MALNRLGQIIVAAAFESRLDVFRLTAAGHQNDRDFPQLRVAAHFPAGPKTIEFWHNYVHQDQAGQFSQSLFHCFLAVVRQDHLKLGVLLQEHFFHQQSRF